MNTGQVIEVVQEEGLDRAILDHIDWEDISDTRLSILWEEAQAILDEIIVFLEEEAGYIY